MRRFPMLLRPIFSSLRWPMRRKAQEGCSASPVSDDDLFVWSATVYGIPWEGGVVGLRLTFADSYPEKPPRVRFTCEVFHPNVSKDGGLCMDIMNDAWSSCHNVCSILTSVQSLLTDPNPSSPAIQRLPTCSRTTFRPIIRECGGVLGDLLNVLSSGLFAMR